MKRKKGNTSVRLLIVRIISFVSLIFLLFGGPQSEGTHLLQARGERVAGVSLFQKFLKRRRVAPKVFRDLVPSPHAREDVAQEASNKVPLAHIPVTNTFCSYEIHGRELLRNVPYRLLHSHAHARHARVSDRLYLRRDSAPEGLRDETRGTESWVPIQFVIPPPLRTKVS